MKTKTILTPVIEPRRVGRNDLEDENGVDVRKEVATGGDQRGSDLLEEMRH